MATFNLKAARNFAIANKKDNSLDIELVIDAINSIEKRIKYLEYFYFLFSESSSKNELLFDRLGESKDRDGFVTRHKYEAFAFAFLSNLHEIIDSYPFLYLGIFDEIIHDQSTLNWTKLKPYQSSASVANVFKLKKSAEFSKLETINNIRKHRALPKIANQYTYLEIKTTQDSEEQYQNLRDLMSELHDCLLPKYIDVLNMTFAAT